LLTLKSTVAFFSLFFFVDIALLLLALGYILQADGMPNEKLLKAGGLFALLGAFLAWYNAFAGIADSSNSFFLPPVVHFPWSEKKRSARREADEGEA
jgi:succinate-acetate transporter protein